MKNSLMSQLESAQGNFPDFKWGGKEEKHFRRSADRGFTLVEMIVTIAVLVILAALLVPSLVGWIDRSQGKSYAVEARAVYLAAQTIESDHYDGTVTPYFPARVFPDPITSTREEELLLEEIRKLSGVDVQMINIKVSGGSDPVTAHEIVAVAVRFIPKGKDEGVTMVLKDGVWNKASDGYDWSTWTDGGETGDGDGEWTGDEYGG